MGSALGRRENHGKTQCWSGNQTMERNMSCNLTHIFELCPHDGHPPEFQGGHSELHLWRNRYRERGHMSLSVLHKHFLLWWWINLGSKNQKDRQLSVFSSFQLALPASISFLIPCLLLFVFPPTIFYNMLHSFKYVSQRPMPHSLLKSYYQLVGDGGGKNILVGLF